MSLRTQALTLRPQEANLALRKLATTIQTSLVQNAQATKSLLQPAQKLPNSLTLSATLAASKVLSTFSSRL